MSQLTPILLVEDDDVDIMNVQRAFQKNNIKNILSVAKNGLEALEILQGKTELQLNTLPIILLDINMPQMGGIEFLKELRNDSRLKSCNVFVMTTSNEDCDKISAFNLNVAGYILKPLSFESFVESLSILNNYWHLCEQPVYPIS